MWRRNSRPRPCALVRALDQAGDVGHDVGLVADLDHAEVGLERGERVVGDLRRRARDRARAASTCRRSAGRRGRRRTAASARARGGSSSPRWPVSEMCGAWLLGEAKCVLPRPPRPPCATTSAIALVDEVADHVAGRGVRDDGAGRHAQLQVGAVAAVLLVLARRCRRGRPGTASGSGTRRGRSRRGRRRARRRRRGRHRRRPGRRAARTSRGGS